MIALIGEIESIIEKFQGSAKESLADFYLHHARKKLSDAHPFDRKKVLLLKSVAKYLSEKKRSAFVEEVFKWKVVHQRALVLDLVAVDYSLERQYFQGPERWMEKIVQDVKDTFDFNDEQERYYFRVYNGLFCKELVHLFCSCEKFNTAGNQFLINLIAYQDSLGRYTDYDFAALYKRFVGQFNPEKASPRTELEKIYAEYKRKVKRNEKKNAY